MINMKLDELLTKWALMGILGTVKTRYSNFDENTQVTMQVKSAELEKGSFTAYLLYRETEHPNALDNTCQLINADVLSNLFNMGPMVIGATLVELDRKF